ncbi:DUF2911 domain-containing protein [Maribacter sp. 2210JD10-5]|uniref:DUF2911 domain-containing protein n=1 Tax=Maribacter sp. 2210JD10-5 TaxID=3386272 RepID=UPI0039BC31F8
MKFLKRLVITLFILGGLFYFVGVPYLQKQTKKYSPEKTATHTFDNAKLSVNYSSPSKKNRIIFGELVPFGQVWRTGANEPTTFTNSAQIDIIDKKLPAGTYSLWTVPGKESWKIIFNKEVPDWGVTLLSGGSETTRNPKEDAVTVEVPARTIGTPVEQFTIDFKNNENQLYLNLLWDTVSINVPINK